MGDIANTKRRWTKFAPWVILLAALGAAGMWFMNYNKKLDKQPYRVENPKAKTISKTVDTTGLVNIEDEYKISALVTGTVKQILVEQNQKVKKGEILAIIDNGKDDTDVKAAEGTLTQIEAGLAYQIRHFSRIDELHKSGYVSDDAYELECSKLTELRGQRIYAQANLEKAKIEWENTKIRSPVDGIVTSIGITEGAGITTILDATVLFIVAGDLTKMEAMLDIDEGDIADIKEGQKIDLTFDCYGDKKFSSTINSLSYGSFKKNGGVTFEAKAKVDNTEMLLRPGMTTSGEIMVAEATDALTISTHALLIPRTAVIEAAKIIGYAVRELAPLETGEKSVWVVGDEIFHERKVKLGITDEAYHEVLDGVTAEDKILIDIEEKNQLEALYKKMMGKL